VNLGRTSIGTTGSGGGLVPLFHSGAAPAWLDGTVDETGIAEATTCPPAHTLLVWIFMDPVHNFRTVELCFCFSEV